MKPPDFAKRVTFCNWFLQEQENDIYFKDKIIWTDEAKFKLDGIANRRNDVYLSQENPHLHVDKQVNAAGLNVWCGLCSRGLVGPFFVDDNINGSNYLKLLKEKIIIRINELYEVLPSIHVLNDGDFLFQQDGAPAHYYCEVREYLDVLLPNSWLGRVVPIEFPARSPDLTPMDFFLWDI